MMESMEDDVMRMSVKELKDIIFKHGRSIEQMLDKGELRKLAAECLRLEALPDDREVTGERTVDERNAEGFANAEHLDAEEFLDSCSSPNKRQRTTAEPEDHYGEEEPRSAADQRRLERDAAKEEERARQEASSRSAAEAKQERTALKAVVEQEKARKAAVARSAADAEEARADARRAKEEHQRQRDTGNFNHASVETMQAVPGIGPKLAQQIASERARAPFRSYDDAMKRICGLGEGKVKLLKTKFPRCV